MKDILLRVEDNIFSYRVAGICLNGGKILLHKAKYDDGYALPGGHVTFGETSKEALKREFEEETGATVIVEQLKWLSENFFNTRGKPYHQVCFYYTVSIIDFAILNTDKFTGKENKGGINDIYFEWVPLYKLDSIKLYPENARELLKSIADTDIKHFVYRENKNRVTNQY